jgi:hypothetical protein
LKGSKRLRSALDCNPSDDDNRSLVWHGTPGRGLVWAIFPRGIDLFKGTSQADGQVLHHLFWLFFVFIIRVST